MTIDANGRIDTTEAVYLLLSVTKRCNLRCSGCYLLQQKSDFFENYDIGLDKAKQIIRLYKESGIRQVVANAEGDPLLYKPYQELITYINSQGFHYKPWLVTNGTLVKKYAEFILENMKEVLISIDGSTDERYTAFRGGNKALFRKVIDGVRSLVLQKDDRENRAEIILNYVATKERINDLCNMIQLAELLGVDTIKFTNFHVINEDSVHRPLYRADTDVTQILREIVARKDYAINIMLPCLFSEKYSPFSCRMLDSVVIGSQGNFSPCCRIIPGEQWGNYFNSSEKHNNVALRKFREQVISARVMTDLPVICRECSHLNPSRAFFSKYKRAWFISEVS